MKPPPLVLVPGLLCDAALWEAQVAALRDDSPCWVADVTRDDTMEGMARRLLDEAPFDRFALAGLSMGGFVALATVRAAPQRVDRLALLDTNARPDTPERTRERRVFMALARQAGGFTSINRSMMPRLVHPSRFEDTRLLEAIDAMAARVGLAGYLNQQNAIIARPDSRPGLAAIACPTLVLCGREDVLTPLEFHEEMAAGIPGARLVQVDHCGHMSTMEQPEAVNAALRAWLGAARARPEAR
jgi:pimeloyl-ACP methyl ester carboxylesterase